MTVVDPGVGSKRKSIAARTAGGQYIITPDNGSLSHIARVIGIDEVREIRESVGRRKDSDYSYTFHGRDVFAYTGALLASNQVTFEEIGDVIPKESIVLLEGLQAVVEEDRVTGTIETLDVRFGSLWTNISRQMFEQLGIQSGDTLDVSITNGKTRVYHSFVDYGHTFADVEIGEPLLYVNSMDHIGLAINQGNFSRAYNIGIREPWRITVKKI